MTVRPMTTGHREREEKVRKKQDDIEMRNLSAELVLLNAYKAVMDTDEGKTVLLDILNRADPFEGEHQKNNGIASYKFGRQSIGKEIIKMITSAGFRLDVSSLSKKFNVNRIQDIETKLSKILNKGRPK